MLQATKEPGLYAEYDRRVSLYTADRMTVLFEQASPLLPAEYHKVWRSYQSRKNGGQADEHTKELMRQKVKRLQAKNGVTNYRIYTDLKLNPGNLNAWLKHGDGDKVSLETARRTLRYVENRSVQLKVRWTAREELYLFISFCKLSSSGMHWCRRTAIEDVPQKMSDFLGYADGADTMVIQLKQEIDAIEMACDSCTEFYDRETGETVSLPDPVWTGEADEELEKLLESEPDRFLRFPTKFEIHEYTIIESFIEVLPVGKIRNELAQAIRGKGAFRRFKNTIRYYEIEQLWYDYLENAYREIAIRWCREHDLKYIEK